MPHVAKKTPRSQTETGPPEPFAEPAEAPASEVPEGTAGQDGDGDLGGDAGEAAASSAARNPPVDDGRADEAAAEEGAALAAAPTQTLEAAGIFGSPVKEGEKSDMDTDEDEEAGEQAVGKEGQGQGQEKRQASGNGSSAAPHFLARPEAEPARAGRRRR